MSTYGGITSLICVIRIQNLCNLWLKSDYFLIYRYTGISSAAERWWNHPHRIAQPALPNPVEHDYVGSIGITLQDSIKPARLAVRYGTTTIDKYFLTRHIYRELIFVTSPGNS